MSPGRGRRWARVLGRMRRESQSMHRHWCGLWSRIRVQRCAQCSSGRGSAGAGVCEGDMRQPAHRSTSTSARDGCRCRPDQGRGPRSGEPDNLDPEGQCCVQRKAHRAPGEVAAEWSELPTDGLVGTSVRIGHGPVAADEFVRLTRDPTARSCRSQAGPCWSTGDQGS
jgi:hypothetical protein